VTGGLLHAVEDSETTGPKPLPGVLSFCHLLLAIEAADANALTKAARMFGIV
jgi:hypothetical protein